MIGMVRGGVGEELTENGGDIGRAVEVVAEFTSVACEHVPTARRPYGCRGCAEEIESRPEPRYTTSTRTPAARIVAMAAGSASESVTSTSICSMPQIRASADRSSLSAVATTMT